MYKFSIMVSEEWSPSVDLTGSKEGNLLQLVRTVS